MSIRIGRKLSPNQFSQKKPRIHSPTPSPPFQEIYISGIPLRHPPPSAITITWIWNTDEVRNWLELPPEITLRVFTKLETIDILLTVSQVCSSWRNLSKEPILYRSIVIGAYDPLFRGKWMRKAFSRITMEAVNRSHGKLVQFSCANMRGLNVHDVQGIIDSSTSIKSLGLGLCSMDHVRREQLIQLIKCIPSLEQLFLHYMILEPSDVQDIGVSCPKLKYLQIGIFHYDVDDIALQIAKSMPGLRRLHLLSNSLTINGFQAILDGCQHLEYMNIKGFHNVEGDLSKKYIHRIKSSTLLNQTYEFGEEHEFYLETTNDGQRMIEEEEEEEEEESDYGGLSLYKTSFVGYNNPFLTIL